MLEAKDNPDIADTDLSKEISKYKTDCKLAAIDSECTTNGDIELSENDLARMVEADKLPEGDWPGYRSVPVSVLIPARNENNNIVECIRHLLWADQIVVVDSQSTDNTVALAQAMGCEVYQFKFSDDGWPKKKNWALENVKWKNEWVLIMDADEHMMPALAHEIKQIVDGIAEPGNGCGDGYWINRRFIFMGKWIKHCGYYPSWNVRLFKHQVGRYERIGTLGDTGSGDNEVHEHVILDTGEAGYLSHEFLHYAYPDIDTWVEKHTRYATWEAYAMHSRYQGSIHPTLFGGPIARRRWLKTKTGWLPFRPTFRFLYSFILKRGFLDGYPGYVMCRLLAWYEFCIRSKYHELHRLQKASSNGLNLSKIPLLPKFSSSAMNDEQQTEQQAESGAGDSGNAADTSLKSHSAQAHNDNEAMTARHTSPWTLWEKIGRMLWYITEASLFRYSLRPMYKWRNFLLRLFGAQVDKTCRIRSTVTIEVPWHLTIGAQSIVGDYAILYCLGPVIIGERVTISQYAHLCAGSHDFTRSDMPLLRPQIVIEDDVWVSADVFVGPGLKIGKGTVVGARASVFNDLPSWKICVGNPAKAIKDRKLDSDFSPANRTND